MLQKWRPLSNSKSDMSDIGRQRIPNASSVLMKYGRNVYSEPFHGDTYVKCKFLPSTHLQIKTELAKG